MSYLNKMAAAAALSSTAPRAMIGVYADASDPAKLMADFRAAFDVFKAATNEELAKKADVVLTEKVDRVNAELTRLQAASDALAEKMAVAQLGGDGHGVGRSADPAYAKLFSEWMRSGNGDAAVKTSQSEGPRAAVTKTPAEGGYLAPVEWDRTLTGKLKIISPMRTHARLQSISGAGFTKVFQDRSIGSGWVGETAARPATGTPVFANLTFGTGELYANPAMSQQVIDDSEIALEQWLVSEIDTEFARQEGIAFLSGDGVNKPNGILTYITGGTNADTHPWGAITAVNSGHATQLTADGIINLIYNLPSEMSMNAKFFANLQTIAAMRKLKDGQGNFLWQPSFEAGQPGRLAGVPVVEMAGMPDIAAGAKAALYGDMDATYIVVDRVGLRMLRDPYTNKPFVHFYTTKRVGGGVWNPEPMRALNISA